MAFNRGSVNKVVLVGRCGADPETRSLPSGDKVANLSLATTSAWRDRNTNENKERTEWHRVAFYARTAEIVSQYVRKGSLIYVEGSLRTREWERDGVKRYTTEIIADSMTMLGSRGDAGAAPRPEPPANSAPAGAASTAPAAPTKGAPAEPPPLDEFEDDIPF